MKHMSRIVLILITLSTLGLAGLVAQPAAAQEGMSWTVEYYNNVSLSGAPAVTEQVPGVGFNWTATAPVAGVVPDNFSARYTGVITLGGGTYEIRTQADDGVRVYVNGSLLINEWHVSSGLTYTRQFTSIAGPNTIVVEYYEGQGVAFLSFDLQPVNAPTPTPAPTGATATVTAYYLNVRNRPDPVTGTILTVISRGQSFPIIGRNSDSSWWQINAGGTTGWVSGRYVTAVNTAGVPVTDPSAPTPTNFTATAQVNLNIRSGPGLTNPVVGWLPIFQTAQVIGRNTDNSWWQVRYGTVTGWVSAPYTTLQPGADINRIPVTG
jgi:uncharacterized protein YraI